MRKPWEFDDEKNIVRMSYKNSDNMPGIEKQYTPQDGQVQVSIPLDKLGLTKEEEALAIKLAGDKFDVDNRLIKFQIDHFPFKEMNEKKAKEAICDLIKYVKVHIFYNRLKIQRSF